MIKKAYSLLNYIAVGFHYIKCMMTTTVMAAAGFRTMKVNGDQTIFKFTKQKCIFSLFHT